ncbi:SDR family oxidoreductase [Paenibacillus sp. 8b26]|uniref:SDR family oxidoreductase n=1 Tax=Paenibacillus sp. 8b26 TaxID=3424133 RepID=UPI003D6545D8
MHNKPVALVTGANKGIGYQIAKDLVTHGFTVLIGSRNFENGETAAKNIGSEAHGIQLDVTDHSSVYAAAERIKREFGRLDVLVNNAGIAFSGILGTTEEEMKNVYTPSLVPLDEVRGLFETNVFGVIAVTQAMLPLLRDAKAGRIVNISSELGSLTRNLEPGSLSIGYYGPSKTAVNAVTVAFAVELASTNIKVNAVCPGFTATDMNNFQGTNTVEQAAALALRFVLLDENGPTGTFSNKEGIIPW